MGKAVAYTHPESGEVVHVAWLDDPGLMLVVDPAYKCSCGWQGIALSEREEKDGPILRIICPSCKKPVSKG